MASTNPRSICGTAVTIDLVEEVIKTKKPSNSKIASFNAIDVGTGHGFLSVLAKIDLVWEPTDVSMPNIIVAKIPTSTKLSMFTKGMEGMQDLADTMMKQLHMLHNCEVSAYELFSQTQPPIPLPFMYGVKKMVEGGELTQPAYLIMESLDDCAGVNFIKLDRPSEQQTGQILRMIGTLHGWSLKHQELTHKIIEPVDIMQIMFSDPKMFKMEPFIETVKTSPWDKYFTPEMIAKLPQLEISIEAAAKIPVLNKEFGVPDVMNHGDMHTNNMMFKEKGAGDIKAMIDWQCVFFGSPCNDLCRIVSFGCADAKHNTPVMREQWLKIYYQAFKTEFGAEPPFTFEQLHECFKKTYVLMMRMFLPMMSQFANMFANLPGMTEQSTNDLKDLFASDTKLVTEDLMKSMGI